VIMAENILRHLSERRPTGHRVVREVQHAALEVARPLTFAVVIIMTVYVPILTFQRIEGKLFRPMAVTISVAVVGALLLTLTLIPVLSTFLFRSEEHRSELQSRGHLVCRLLLEKKNNRNLDHQHNLLSPGVDDARGEYFRVV